jgi:hypothetical protein
MPALSPAFAWNKAQLPQFWVAAWVGYFSGVDFAGISFVSHGAGLGIGFGNHVSSHGNTASQQSGATCADLDNGIRDDGS